MHHFEYRNGEMFAEDVPVKRIAKEVGTPAYVYSLATLKRHFRVFDEAFAKIPHIVCFSVKANSNIALLSIIAVTIWQYSGYSMVIFLAGLQGIPPEVLEAADLTWAHLEGAALEDCDLSGAQHLEAAFLAGAIAGDHTRWPVEFDPWAHGVRRVR